MDAATLAQVTNPFFTTRTTRHVGLGLPLFAAAAERAGGQLVVESEPGQGTTSAGDLRLFPPGSPAVGRPGRLHCWPSCFCSQRQTCITTIGWMKTAFDFDTADIRTALGDVPLSHPTVRWWLAGFLQEGEAEMAAARWEIAVGF